jgi:DNA-directed RNA polymerase subunit RPC12/RpoP
VAQQRLEDDRIAVWATSLQRRFLVSIHEVQGKVPVKIGEIGVKGHPRDTETACACGGRLIYKQAPFATGWNGHHLEIGSIWAYRCTNCSNTILLPQVSKELKKQIDETTGRSPTHGSLLQRWIGRNGNHG